MLISNQLRFFLISNRSGPHSSNLIFAFRKHIKEINQNDFAYFINSFYLLFLAYLILGMRIQMPIIGAGVIILAFGVLFFLQGNSIVGPPSSFMYSNPKWIAYGQWIAMAGVVVLAAGISFSLRRPRS
jgi:hypothetical protein